MSSSPSRDIRLADNPAESRYEAHVDNRLAGVAEYERRPGRVVFVHTEVAREFAGLGLGQRLARFAIEDARARSERVIPRCPFIAAWLERHPEFADIVAGRRPPIGRPG